MISPLNKLETFFSTNISSWLYEFHITAYFFTGSKYFLKAVYPLSVSPSTYNWTTLCKKYKRSSLELQCRGNIEFRWGSFYTLTHTFLTHTFHTFLIIVQVCRLILQIMLFIAFPVPSLSVLPYQLYLGMYYISFYSSFSFPANSSPLFTKVSLLSRYSYSAMSNQ